MNHTTASQDRDIIAAETHSNKTYARVEALVAIIQDLDDRLTGWEEAAGVSGPRELESKLSRLEGRVDELQAQLEDSERNGGEYA